MHVHVFPQKGKNLPLAERQLPEQWRLHAKYLKKKTSGKQHKHDLKSVCMWVLRMTWNQICSRKLTDEKPEIQLTIHKFTRESTGERYDKTGRSKRFTLSILGRRFNPPWNSDQTYKCPFLRWNPSRLSSSMLFCISNCSRSWVTFLLYFGLPKGFRCFS